MVKIDEHNNNNNYSFLRSNSDIVDILLQDRSSGENIIWGTDTYSEKGEEYEPIRCINGYHVTNIDSSVIVPRSQKKLSVQKNRTKSKAEVFTPMWVIEMQNDSIDEMFKDLDLLAYVEKTWLEITCGEGPYMCSHYDMITGGLIDMDERIGFVDRKIQRITEEVNQEDLWMSMTIKAYQSSFGYEFQGDSLYLARENMLYTFIDYYIDKFKRLPSEAKLLTIADIISYNVFQMDGLKYTTPLNDEIDAKIKDWDNGEMFKFKDLMDN